jgi:hypothetical protein
LTADLFQGHERLHLPLGTLKLFDEDVSKANDVLLGCKAMIVELIAAATSIGTSTSTCTRTIAVKGVECTNDNLQEVDVLCAKVGFTDDGGGAALLHGARCVL